MFVHVAMPHANESVSSPRSSKFSSARALMARARRAAPARSAGKALDSRTFSPHRMSVRATSSAVAEVKGSGLEVPVAEQGVVAGDVHQLARPLPDRPAHESNQGFGGGTRLRHSRDAHRLSPCLGHWRGLPHRTRQRLRQRCLQVDWGRTQVAVPSGRFNRRRRMSTNGVTHLHGSCTATPPASRESSQGEARREPSPGGKEKAHPGRPVPAGLIHCVCGRVRTVKARWAHVPPSATPTLTVLAPLFGEILLGDVHTDVHAGRRKPAELGPLSAMRHAAA